ncbi:MAG: VanZ family protein [Lachnospiraceae bacterium]|nr:VanZ family protein [Lachnospiraceae bacterium]
MQQYFKYIHLAISASLNIDRIYYKIAIIFMVIMIFVLFIQKNNKSSQHEIISIVPSIALTLLVAYLFLVFVSTVFSRMTKTYYQYELLPFWSYKQIKEDASWIVFWQHGLFWENILNIVMLMPMGILLPIIMRR